jgi:hypothetical protein
MSQAFGEDGVQVIDISDPSNPTAVGSIVDDATTLLHYSLSESPYPGNTPMSHRI